MTMNNPKRWQFSTHTNFFRDSEGIIKSMVKMGADEKTARQALQNTLEVAEKASFKLQPYPVELPSPISELEDEEEYFFLACIDGLKARNEAFISDPVYWERLNKEIEIIVKMKFVRYFLIVADMIRWAKKNQIFVGPGRGSVGGSLVAYAMGITELDPVKYGLPFERFIAPDRIDLPDIDIDIEDKNRFLVEQYLKDKYGHDNVAHVSTFNSLLGRMAIRDVSRVLEINEIEVDQAAKSIVRPVEGDPRFFNTIEDTRRADPTFAHFCEKYPKVYEYALKLEGQVRTTGVHAAGLVISPKPFGESKRAYIVSNKNDQVAVNWDKDDVEFFGMVKIDLLGLSTHSVISHAIKLIKQRKNIDINLAKLPLDDKRVFKEISEGNTATMFQLSAPGTSAYCREMKPNSYEEIAAILALWRPGPIQSGMAKEYVEVKFKKRQPIYLHPAHQKITEKTNGQLIYQEQLTDLIMELAGHTYVEADKIRKIAAKKLGSAVWQAEGEKFIKGCLKKGTLDEYMAEELWKRLEGWAAYGFNAAHAYAYALVAYWSGWLKINYPAEWMCSYLNYGSTERETKDGESNLDIALKEAGRCGLNVLPPDINKSMDIWSVEDDKVLRAGLQEVKNIGEKNRLAIRAAQNAGHFKNLNDFLGRIDRRVVNVRVVKSLLYAGALDSLPEQPWALWKANFDELYEAFDPKKTAQGQKYETALYNAAKSEVSIRADDYLNYSSKILDAHAESIEGIMEALGKGYSYKDESIVPESDGKSWTIADALVANLPGLKAQIIKDAQEVKVADLRKQTLACDLCDLRRTCNKPVPIAKGIFNVMIVSDVPGVPEDRYSKPLIGEAGNLLFGMLENLGKLTREYFYVDTALHCHPPGNNLSSLEYMDKCPHLANAIEIVKPKVILCLGAKALYSLTGKETGIMKLNGTTEWSSDKRCWITFSVHPNMALRGKDGAMDMFKKGIGEFTRVIENLIGA